MDKLDFLRATTFRMVISGALVALVLSVGIGAGLGYISSRQKPRPTQFDMPQATQSLEVTGVGDIQGTAGIVGGNKSQNSTSMMLQPAGTYGSGSTSTGVDMRNETTLQGGAN